MNLAFETVGSRLEVHLQTIRVFDPGISQAWYLYIVS